MLNIAGKGGMGVVWKAWDESVQRQVAVKLVLPAHSEDEHLQRLARLERERRVLIELSQHPNVVTLFDILMEPIGYVMEWIEGYDIEMWLKANPGPRPAAVVASIFAPILEAVGYAHERGVIHRDLKSSNVYLQALGDRVTVRVMDFGLARIVQHESNITTGRLIVGTPQYMAPEQVLGNESTPATDIYALGVLLFECLTGTMPLESNSESPIPMLLFKVNNELPPAREKYPELSEELEAVITKATRLDPQERYSSCAEFSDALFAALPTMPSRSRPLIEASTLGVIPKIEHSNDTPSLLTPRFGSDESKISDSTLYGYPDSSVGRQPKPSENVTAVTPFSAITGQANGATASNPAISQAQTQATQQGSRDTQAAPAAHIKILRRAQQQFFDSSREQLIAAGAIVLLIILALLVLPFKRLGDSNARADGSTTVEKFADVEETLGINWLVRGSNSQSPSVVNALQDYKRTLGHWNAGRRGQIIEGHRSSMRCYYNTADLPRERLPVQPLVRASLGLPLAPFYPAEIFVTSTGRDYVTFVERGVAGDGDAKKPYVRVIQMAGGRKATWRVSVESNESAHNCYQSFDTHLTRWKEAEPVAAD